MPSRFLNNITVNDSYTLPSADGDADQIIQTDGAGNLSFVDLSSIEGASSNFVYFEVKNETGSPINKGKGVMAVGTDGNSGHILIDEMIADGSVEPKYFLGVLETTVANGGFARVISFGQLAQFDTGGQNGETWLDGQILWCDPDSAGDFTITEPDGPNVKIPAAIVLKASTNGKIQVRVQANEGIHDLHDTKITSQVDGDVLVWDNTTGVWFNDSTLNIDYTAGNVGIGTTSPGHKLDVNGGAQFNTNTGATPFYITRLGSTDQALSIKVMDDNVRFESIQDETADTYGGFDFRMDGGTTEPNFVVRKNAGDPILHVDGGGNVGIGTTSPGSKLQVDGEIDANGGDGYRINGKPWAAESSNVLRLGDWDGEGFSTSLFDENSIETLRVVDEGVIISSNVSKTPGYGSAANLVVGGSKSSPYGEGVLTLLNNNPTSNALEKTGSIQFAIKDDTTGGYVSSLITGSINQSAGSGSSGGGVLDFKTSSGGLGSVPQTRIRIDELGNVGIGATNPSDRLEVAAANSQLRLTDTDDSKFTQFSYSSGVLVVRNNSTTTTTNQFTLDAAGKMGIGTTSPNEKLEVNGSVRVTGAGLDVGYGNNSNNFVQIGNGRTTNGFAFIDLVGDTTYSDYGLRLVRNNGGANTDSEIIHRGTGALNLNVTQAGSITLKTSNLERVRINSSGNVGIGTTGPASQLGSAKVLDISSTGNGEIILDHTDAGVNSDIGLYSWNRNNDHLAHIKATCDKTTDSAFISFHAQPIGGSFSGPSSNEKMRISSNGNVGIGITGPRTKLHVFGTASSMPALGAGASAAQFGGDSYGTLLSTLTSGRGVIQQGRSDGTPGSYDLLLQPVGGNVGIGTSSARTKLHVSGLTGDDDPALGSSTAPFFVSNTSTSYGLNIGVNNAGASWLQAQSNTSAIAYEMSLNPLGGNVGVGFINPSYKLDVNGTGRFTDTLYYSSLVQQSQADTKKDIANINKNKATAIPFKQYKYKTGDTERVRYGVIVEDIEQHYPELVHIGEDGIKGVSYIDLLVKRVAELEKELEDISLTPGAKGATGPQGPQGLKGAAGATGATGADGNDHLNNVESIAFNEKSGQLEITIKGHKNPFRFNPAK